MARLMCLFVLGLSMTVGETARMPQPQVATIELAGQSLRLGMPRDSVLARFAPNYRLEQMGDSDSFIIETKIGPPFESYGVIAFSSGRLSHVSKRWNLRVTDDVGFGEAVIGVIAHFTQESRRACVIDAGGTQSPGSEQKTAWIICGEKYVEIRYLRLKDGQSVS